MIFLIVHNFRALCHLLARGHGFGGVSVWHFCKYMYRGIKLVEFTAKNYTLKLG